ncbi:MAG: hypothetical protein K2W96_17040 [Gemmataceae bacterium]|nr:hypothetical protein [Gemmataceae bacterium]
MDAVLLAVLVLGADEEPRGKLDSMLVVKDLQGGFAGLTGKVWTVDKDGSWTVGDQGPRAVVKVTGKGKLGAAALGKLAAAVKKYGAGTLKKAGKAPGANPHTVTVSYGKNEATLDLDTGADLPAADEKEMAGRFAGIVAAVKEAVGKAGKK